VAGAEVDNILRFDHDFPAPKVIGWSALRSTATSGRASHLIAHNEAVSARRCAPKTSTREGHRHRSWDSEKSPRHRRKIEELQRAGPQAQ